MPSAHDTIPVPVSAPVVPVPAVAPESVPPVLIVIVVNVEGNTPSGESGKDKDEVGSRGDTGGGGFDGDDGGSGMFPRSWIRGCPLAGLGLYLGNGSTSTGV